MKIKNIGNANFILVDKRGNNITLEPSFTTDVDDAKGRKLLRIYPTLQEVKPELKKVEEKVEKVEDVKEEVKEKPVDVPRETKKKKGKK